MRKYRIVLVRAAFFLMALGVSGCGAEADTCLVRVSESAIPDVAVGEELLLDPCPPAIGFGADGLARVEIEKPGGRAWAVILGARINGRGIGGGLGGDGPSR
ncbi:MAG: hypothetical protein HY791_27555 [Deltaproteobacteria bacterium]|nr:hypothetical protein [Deltaproteobacteria bacterium]